MGKHANTPTNTDRKTQGEQYFHLEIPEQTTQPPKPERSGEKWGDMPISFSFSILFFLPPQKNYFSRPNFRFIYLSPAGAASPPKAGGARMKTDRGPCSVPPHRSPCFFLFFLFLYFALFLPFCSFYVCYRLPTPLARFGFESLLSV